MAVWALIGFMGCGKSSIGRTVAKMLGVGGIPPHHASAIFIDLDEEIEKRCVQSIPDIFISKGEAGFRTIERDTLTQLLTAVALAPLPKAVLISLGGGTLTDPESRELVKKNCKCIYLRARVETLAANLREDGAAAGRPMLAGVDTSAPAEAPNSLESRIAAMMTERGPIYEKTADIILDIDGLSYEQAARQILNSFSR